MRKLIAIIFWLFSSLAAISQTTAVTATITDSDSTVWINPQWSVQFVPNPNFPQLSSYSIGGVPITSTTYSQYIQVSGTGNGSGVISTTLLDNNQILPVGSKYRWVVQSQTSAAATTYLPVTVTGASQSLTSYLSSNAVSPRFSAAAPGAFGYTDVEISVVPQPGGLYYNTVAANQRIWNGTAWGNNGGGSSGGPAYIYLSASSELGAQCVTALATLGATGGVIQFPNSSALTMTTTCANIPQQVSFKGYGKIATKIACSVAAAGDCFRVNQNPTTNGEIGGKFSDFEIDGAGSTTPVLIHLIGGSGWTFDNVQFNPYPGTSVNTATCLEFESGATGIFTEGNTILPSVNFERQCTPSVYIHQAGGADTSFAYNNFNIHLVAQASYGVIVDGAARLYGGFMNIIGNHVGPGNGILTFNDTSGTGGPVSLPSSAFINIQAEESGSGSGIVLNANTSGFINFNGAINNGPGGSFALATTVGGTGASAVIINTPVTSDKNGNFTMPASLSVKSTVTSEFFNLTSSSGDAWSIVTGQGAGTGYINIGDSTSGTFQNIFSKAFAAINASIGYNLPSNGCYQWSSATNGTSAMDSFFGRSGANAYTLGSSCGGTDGSLKTGTIDVTTYKVGGVVGVTKTCTSAIVVVAGIITGCT